MESKRLVACAVIGPSSPRASHPAVASCPDRSTLRPPAEPVGRRGRPLSAAAARRPHRPASPAAGRAAGPSARRSSSRWSRPVSHRASRRPTARSPGRCPCARRPSRSGCGSGRRPGRRSWRRARAGSSAHPGRSAAVDAARRAEQAPGQEAAHEPVEAGGGRDDGTRRPRARRAEELADVLRPLSRRDEVAVHERPRQLHGGGEARARSRSGSKTSWRSRSPYGRPVMRSAISPTMMLSVFEYA